MVLPLYLALTAAEFAFCSRLPEKMAWMACHFSPYGTGLSNLPPALPGSSMVILNDRTPISGHDPKQILCQLKELNPHLLLLDFQRQEVAETTQLTSILVESMDCPVGVSHFYAHGLDCPVFLPPVPPDVPLEEYLTPWPGREIWLEAALDGLTYTVTEKGCTSDPLLHIPENGLIEPDLCCHYQIAEFENRVEFHLYHTADDLSSLLQKAKSHGVTTAVGLYQELRKIKL
jgi:hypothetical protein